jgi:ATP-dependent Lon protease
MLPARNRKDFEDIPEEARDVLEFIWLAKVDVAYPPGSEPEAPDSKQSAFPDSIYN